MTEHEPQRIRDGEEFHPPAPRSGPSRRGFLSALVLGWIGLAGAVAVALGATARFLFPNVRLGPPPEFDAGSPDDFEVGRVDERFQDSHGVWIVREEDGFYALSTVCTHLGCTPHWNPVDEAFQCPCHGSAFRKDGVNVAGPAPRPLERYRITLDESGRLHVDKSTRYRQERGEWERAGAFLRYP